MNDLDNTFGIDPDSLLKQLREGGWLRELATGRPVIWLQLIPYLEREAIKCFQADTPSKSDEEECLAPGTDLWRSHWLNEALHLCRHHEGYSVADEEFLSPVSRSAINVFVSAARLRTFIELDMPEAASAWAMVLICEAMKGGYSLKMEAAEQATQAIKRAQQQRYKKGVGRLVDPLAAAKSACIEVAAALWAVDPTTRMGTVAGRCREAIKGKLDQLAPLKLSEIPGGDTIKKWLKAARDQGTLTIPEAAQRPGRSRK